MSDINTAIAAERDHAIRRGDANELAAECASRRAEEERAARLELEAEFDNLKSAYANDVNRLTAERDQWKVEAMKWIANKGTQHD